MATSRPSRGSRRCRVRPRPHELEIQEPPDPLEISVVVGHEHTAGFATRQRQQHVVGERLGHPRELQPFLAGHLGQHVAGPVPRGRRRCDRPIGALIDPEHMAIQRPQVPGTANPCSQLLGDHDAQVLERSKDAMELRRASLATRSRKAEMNNWVSRTYFRDRRLTARGLATLSRRRAWTWCLRRDRAGTPQVRAHARWFRSRWQRQAPALPPSAWRAEGDRFGGPCDPEAPCDFGSMSSTRVECTCQAIPESNPGRDRRVI